MQVGLKHTIFIVLLLLILGCNGGGRPENYQSAYLKKTGQKFTIILKGRRSLHPAGPFDIGKTYEDSFLYLIPIDSRTIKVEDLRHDSCCYPRFGTIRIQGNKLGINIYAISNS